MIYIFKDNEGDDITFGLIEIKGEDKTKRINELMQDYKNKWQDSYNYEEFIQYLNDKGIKAESIDYKEIEF